jgi:hypothetical protein
VKPDLTPLRPAEPKIQAFSLALLVFALLLLFEVPIWLALRSEVYLATQIVLGAFIVRHLLGRQLTIFEFVGLGFAVGSLVAMCTDQLLVATPIKELSWLIIPAVSTLIVASPKRKQLSLESNASLQLPALFIGFIALAMLVHERYWPLYIAASLIPLLLFNAFKPSGWTKGPPALVRLPLLLLIPLATTYALRNRPSMWWIKTQDFQFFEALSYSLTHWGSNDQVFVQGQPVLYHWFSYAWMGLATKATHAPTWLMQTKIAPIFVVIAIICAVIALLHRLNIKGWKVVVTLCVFAALNDFNFESFSMVFSYIWLLALLYFLHEWCKAPLWRLAFASSFMAAGALGAKSSNIAVLVAGVGMLLLLQLVKKRIAPSLIFSHGAMIALGLTIVYLKLYANSPYDSTINFGTIGIAQDVFGDVDSLPRPQFIIWSIIILVNLMAMYVIALTVNFTNWGKTDEPLIHFTLGALIATTVALLTTVSYYEQEEYFLHSFVLFGSIVVGLTVCAFLTQFANSANKQIQISFGAALLGTVGVSRRIFSDDNSGEFWAIRSRIANGSSIIVLLIASLSIAFIFRKSSLRKNALLFFVASSVLVSTSTLNTRWFTQQQQFKDEVTVDFFAAFMIGSTEFQDFLGEAQKLIPRNAVVASNYECDDPACPTDSFGADREDWTIGGEAMLMTIYLERRMYISGYGFLWQNVELPEFAKQRLRLSADFANSPTTAGMDELQTANVDYFILDKSSGAITNMNTIGTSLLDSPRFELLQLGSN